MRLSRVKKTLVMTNDCPGLLHSRVEYHVESADAILQWFGPKIDKLEWAKVLAYFKWTHDKCRSEAQVRFYVNTTDRRWAAWAFPQRANMGMTTNELDNDDAKKQREQFPDSQWQYLMTVHHHCSGGAFQSSTDERNECEQDGLHLTIGLIDKPRHDMHARFYLAKNCYEPDMSMFWDIGDVAIMTPPDTHDKIARYQMCIHVEAEFPQVWRDNYIEPKGVYEPGRETSGPFQYRGPNGVWVNGSYRPYTQTTPQAAQAGEGVGAASQPTSQGLPITTIGDTVVKRADRALAAMLNAGYTLSELKLSIDSNPEFSDPQVYFDVETVLSGFDIGIDDLVSAIKWACHQTIAEPPPKIIETVNDPRKDSTDYTRTGYDQMME